MNRTLVNNFIESISSDKILNNTIMEGFNTIFETITEPMQHLKRVVTGMDTNVVSKLEPYIKGSMRSKKDAYDNYNLAVSEWSWFGEAINERWGDDQVKLSDDYPYDIESDNIDTEGLLKYMNEEPRGFDNLVSYFQHNIEGNNTSQLMEYQKPLINKWFVHFSNNADSIFTKGFKYGNEDPTKLALTNAGDIKGKEYGDYLFAYELDDVNKYAYSEHGRSNNFKYGDSAIVFIGSGIKFYHHGDVEPQVVFDKKSPNGCFLIKKSDPEREDERGEKWIIYGHNKNNKYNKYIVLASKEKFSDALDWCETNYSQYKKYYNW